MKTIGLIHGIRSGIGALVHGFRAVVSVHVALGLGIKEPRGVGVRFPNVGSHMKGRFAVYSFSCKNRPFDMQDRFHLQVMHDYLSSSSVGHLLHVITSNSARNCVMDLAMDSVASQCPWQGTLQALCIATRCFYFFAGCNRNIITLMFRRVSSWNASKKETKKVYRNNFDPKQQHDWPGIASRIWQITLMGCWWYQKLATMETPQRIYTLGSEG